MTALDYIGTDKLWAGIITEISKRVDQAFGRQNVKLFRATHSRIYSLDPYNQDITHDHQKSKWRVGPVFYIV